MRFNEIDLIAVSEIRKKILFAEIKRNAANIDMKLLKEKADYFLRATGGLSDYEIDYAGLSMEEM